MTSIFNRRQTPPRSGRSSPSLFSSNTTHLKHPQTPVDSLYNLDGADSSSIIISSVLTYPSSAAVQPISPLPASSHSSLPPRSQTVPPPAAVIRFPTMMNSNPVASSGSQRGRRAPTPPPPYVEHLNSQDEADACVTPAQGRSRSRTSSASSWIKRVVSRSSSRASLCKQYEQIPMSAEEKMEAEEAKAQKAKQALAEWNRINDALKAAGF